MFIIRNMKQSGDYSSTVMNRNFDLMQAISGLRRQKEKIWSSSQVNSIWGQDASLGLTPCSLRRLSFIANCCATPERPGLLSNDHNI